MKKIIITGALLAGLPTLALADEASPEMLNAALQAAIAQRDQALNESIGLSAQLSLARREIGRLRDEVKATKKDPDMGHAPSTK